MRRSTACVLAATAIESARSYLARYASDTDAPDSSIVDAADLLDEAAECLALADFSDAIKDVPDGDE